MRKKSRYIRNGAVGGAFVFVLLDGIGQYIQLKEEDKAFWENLNLQQSLEASVKGFFIGGTLGALFYKLQQWEEQNLPFSPDKHLHNVLHAYSQKRNPQYTYKVRKLTQHLKEKIAIEFGELLIEKPMDFGSEKTKTAISQLSDFDILIPFAKQSGTLLNLYNMVFDFIEETYTDECFELRKQQHSIGLLFDDGDVCINVDLVPARERNNFHQKGDVTIIRRGKRLFDINTTIKSNIWTKRKLLVNQPETRRIIKLMKIYRTTSSAHFSSPAIVS